MIDIVPQPNATMPSLCNLTKIMKKIIARVSLLLLTFIGLPALAGPIPFTQNQFPVWYAVSSTPVIVTNTTTETVLFQTAVPPAIVGNLGFMRFTSVYETDDAAADVHVVTAYLGGTGTAIPPTGSTPNWTNSFKLLATPTTVQQLMFPFVGGFSNLVYSTTTTNSFQTFQNIRQTKIVGTQTNGLLLTVTATNPATTNAVALNAFIVEALSQ